MSDTEMITRHASAQQTVEDQLRWDERYRAGKQPGQGEVSAWIRAQSRYLSGGLALDVACGAGRHSLWLAGLSYRVDAVDISEVGLQRLQASAQAAGFSEQIHLIHADLAAWRPEPERYDLILVVRYLNRGLWPDLVSALRPGGLLLYRTFHIDMLQLRPEFSPRHLLQPGELVAAFPSLQLLAYEERRWRPGSESYEDCTSSILARRD